VSGVDLELDVRLVFQNIEPQSTETPPSEHVQKSTTAVFHILQNLELHFLTLEENIASIALWVFELLVFGGVATLLVLISPCIFNSPSLLFWQL
jgi:hypothetical protein